MGQIRNNRGLGHFFSRGVDFANKEIVSKCRDGTQDENDQGVWKKYMLVPSEIGVGRIDG